MPRSTKQPKIAGILILLIIVAAHSGALRAKQPPVSSTELREKADDLLWIGDSLLIAVDYGGFVKMSARLQAFRVPTMQELWYTEIPVGRKQSFSGALWVDDDGSTLYIGRGPFSSLDLTTGTIHWTMPYDSVGYVHRVEFGTERLLVLGSRTKSGFRILWSPSPEAAESKAKSAGSAWEHLEDPILFSIDRPSGAIIWKYPFEPGKEHKKKSGGFWSGGNKTVTKVREQTRLFLVHNPLEGSLASGEVLIQAKGISCLNLADGSEHWKLKDRFIGDPCVVGGHILAVRDNRLVRLDPLDGAETWRSTNKVRSSWDCPDPFLVRDSTVLINSDGRLCLWNLDSGTEVWRSDKKVGDHSIVAFVTPAADVVSVFPGKYDISEDAFKDDYLITCASIRDGMVRWQFKGEKYSSCAIGVNDCIQVLDDQRLWRLDPVTGKPICACKVGDGIPLIDCPLPTVLRNDGLHSFTVDGKKETWKYKAKLSDDDMVGAFYSGQTLVMPTRKSGVIGLDINSGVVLWSIETSATGEIVPSESLKYLALPVDKQLQVYDIGESM